MMHSSKRNVVSAALALVAAIFFASPVDAQSRDRQFQANQFRPMPSQTTNYFQVTSVRGLRPGGWELGLTLNHAWKPLVVSRIGGNGASRVGAIITHLTTLDLLAAVGLFDGFEVGIALPIYLFQAGEDFDIQGLAVPNPQAGVGDLRLVPKMRLWRSDSRRWGLGLVADIAVPTGINREDFQTEGWRVEPRFAFEYEADWLRVAANVGWFFRPQTRLENIAVDDTLAWGAAAEFEVIDDRLYLVPEYVSQASVLEPVNLEEVPMELRGGAKYYPIDGLLIEGGVGVGLVEGFGTPDVRLFTGIAYSPPVELTCQRAYADNLDDDGDLFCEFPLDEESGLVCDVCRPRLDGDFPESSEISEFAGLDDENGPVRYGYYEGRSTDDNMDRDSDGWADGCDVCHPLDACNPRLNTNDNLDVDGDGIPDGCDACPDGGDMLDSDSDCIADCFDECPQRPEDYNGQLDSDGCPDGAEECICDADVMDLPFTVSALELFVTLGGTEREARQRAEPGVDLDAPIAPFFFAYDMWEETVSNDAFDRLVRMDLLLDQISATLQFSICDYRVQIFGHTDSDGASEYNDWLSTQRAEHVSARLQEAGVPEESIVIIPQGEGSRLFSDSQTDDYDPGNMLNRRAILQLACSDVPMDPPMIDPQPGCWELEAVRCGEEIPANGPNATVR
ncbi:MAG: hypothetical protein ACJA1R_000226 [Flavobacteriales bacterium]|jgi:hypothetical protein